MQLSCLPSKCLRFLVLCMAKIKNFELFSDLILKSSVFVSFANQQCWRNLTWFHNCLVYLQNFKSKLLSCILHSQNRELWLVFWLDFKKFCFHAFRLQIKCWRNVTWFHNFLVYLENFKSKLLSCANIAKIKNVKLLSDLI